MKRIIVSNLSFQSGAQSTYTNLNRVFDKDPNAVLMYDTDDATYTIQNTRSGMKLVKDTFKGDDQITEPIAIGAYTIAKVIQKIQPDIDKWQHARIQWE